MQKAIDEELDKLRASPPEAREVQRALNQIEASFYRRMERVSSKADQLNAYVFAGKSPDWFAQDLARYTSLTAAETQAAIVNYLPAGRRVELIVQPEGKR
jgi:predicted Zn-dependent peptidase